MKDGETVLQAVTVSIAHKSSLTDLAGEFSITISPGTYMLTITHVGYKKIEQPVIINAGKSQFLQFNMIKDELIGETVVLGSRSPIQRSNLNTPVPVDVISSQELDQAGQQSLSQKLNVLAPSFNTSRQLVNETVTLRGLDPDHVLILMNGSRYHNSAFLNQGTLKGELGKGSVANDINSIPFSAIEKIEILRDGASAQYGSDAIAGVMNIQLKKSTGKTSINFHLGQQYKDDGQNITIGINHGVSLNKKGFLNFSMDFRYRQPTYRGGIFNGTVYKNYPLNPTHDDSVRTKTEDDSIIQARGFNRKDAVSNVGISKLISFGVLVNGGYRVSNHVELFWTTVMNYRKVLQRGMYRFPKSLMQVNTTLYPDGFKIRFSPQTWDVSAIAGAKGETNSGWYWNFTSVYSNNSNKYNLSNSNNASQWTLGVNAPTSFYIGTDFTSQQINTINFTRDFAKEISGIKSFNLSLGAEFRFENYQIRNGEEASWQNYSHDGRQPGSQGAPGFSDSNAVNKNRNVAGGYVDLEVDANDHFLFDVAGRYEYYNDFGGNIAGKFATRYKISNKFSLRGSISNGFHAPSLQQHYFSSTSTAWVKRGGIFSSVLRGTFRNDSYIAQAFGIPPLQAEKSLNLSGGFIATLSNHIYLTIDAYWIQIKNRIVFSGAFDTTNNQAVKNILANLPGINQVQFITNAINTRTRGIDLVLNGNWNIRKTNLGVTLAANFNRTQIFGAIQASDKLPADDSLNTNTLLNIEERGKVESGQPRDKIILNMNYKKGKTGFTICNTRFGKTATIYNGTDRTRDEFFSPKILTDISIHYTPKVWLILTVGANNVFDVYPDRLKNRDNTNEGILIYSNEASPFGYNGGYYFVSMSLNF